MVGILESPIFPYVLLLGLVLLFMCFLESIRMGKIVRYPPPGSSPLAGPPPRRDGRQGHARATRAVDGISGLPAYLKIMMLGTFVMLAHVVVTSHRLQGAPQHGDEYYLQSPTQLLAISSGTSQGTTGDLARQKEATAAPKQAGNVFIHAGESGGASCAPRPPFGSSAAFLLHVSGPLTSSSRTSSLILEAAARLADVAELWVLYQNASTGPLHGTRAFEDAEAVSTLHGLQQRTAYPLHVFAYDPTPHAQGHKDKPEQAKGQGGSVCSAGGRAFQSGVAQWAQQCLSGKGGKGAGLKFVWLAASSSQGGELMPVSKIASLVHLYHDKDDDVDDVLALQAAAARSSDGLGSMHTHAAIHRLAAPLLRNTETLIAALCPDHGMQAEDAKTEKKEGRARGEEAGGRGSDGGTKRHEGAKEKLKITEEYTLVSAFYDLGRDKWAEMPRGIDKYFANAQRTLRFPNPMVIYTSPDLIDKVKEMRERLAPSGSRTRYVSRPLHEIPYYNKLKLCEMIMGSTQYKEGIGKDKLQAAEYTYPVYDIVNWAKTGFLQETVKENPHRTTHFGWVDFGSHDIFFEPETEVVGHQLPLGHSVTSVPSNQSQVRFLALEDPSGMTTRATRKSAMAIAASRHDVLLGPIFGGAADAVLGFAAAQAQAVDAFLEEGVVSDDQDVYLYMYQRMPWLFDVAVSTSGWTGLFKQF